MAKPIALVALDSFKGTAGAPALCDAAGEALAEAFEVRRHPLSDGGDGFAEVLSASCEVVEVLHVDATDALGRPTSASIPVLRTSRGEVAVVEAARACGLAQVGGAAGNDPLGASTRGVGQLISAAAHAGWPHVVVGCGGSATTDGGAGAVAELLGREPMERDIGELRVEVAVDVATRFTDAAVVFAPQKGASPEQVELLTRRLRWLAIDYAEAYATSVDRLPGSGAAGGLAGGLAALGARIVDGFDLVAELTGLDRDLEGAELVVTGEGRLDATSLEGKVVARVAELAPSTARVVVLAGSTEAGVAEALAARCGRVVEVVDLSAAYGGDATLADPRRAVALAAASLTGA